MIMLLNDVHSKLDSISGGGRDMLIVNRNSEITDKGVEQSSIIANYIIDRYPRPRNVAFSDDGRLKKLIHHLRLNLKGSSFRSLSTLRERDFGVLSGTIPRFDSEIFTQTRICPEAGESISQCKSRGMSVINHYDANFPNDMNIIISHPYLCQILSNAMQNKDITTLEDFWFKKGSMAIFETSPYFKMKESVNILEEKL